MWTQQLVHIVIFRWLFVVPYEYNNFYLLLFLDDCHLSCMVTTIGTYCYF